MPYSSDPPGPIDKGVKGVPLNPFSTSEYPPLWLWKMDLRGVFLHCCQLDRYGIIICHLLFSSDWNLGWVSTLIVFQVVTRASQLILIILWGRSYLVFSDLEKQLFPLKYNNLITKEKVAFWSQFPVFFSHITSPAQYTLYYMYLIYRKYIHILLFFKLFIICIMIK